MQPDAPAARAAARAGAWRASPAGAAGPALGDSPPPATAPRGCACHRRPRTTLKAHRCRRADIRHGMGGGPKGAESRLAIEPIRLGLARPVADEEVHHNGIRLHTIPDQAFQLGKESRLIPAIYPGGIPAQAAELVVHAPHTGEGLCRRPPSGAGH